jgi:uncharacterized protein YlxW (UPF0749 family)
MVGVRKVRVNWTINKKHFDIIKAAAKFQNCSMSKIVETLTQKILHDPIVYLTEQKRELAKQMCEIDEKIETLREMKEEAQIDKTNLHIRSKIEMGAENDANI